jgi:CBS domain containing-hemolysin-like protein
LGSGPNATPAVSQGELRTALAAAEEEGVIESEERALLEGAMDFREKVVREVMTPRLDVVGVSADATLDDALTIALREGHSRLPVYEEQSTA